MLLSDSMNGRSETGDYSNNAAPNASINCSDDKPRYADDHVERRLPEFRSASPLFGDFLAWDTLSCTDWPCRAPPSTPTCGRPGRRRSSSSATPATRRPRTRGHARWWPSWARASGCCSPSRAQGHGAYASKNKCVHSAVDGYLLNGTVPKDGTVCS
ncbi:Peptidase OS=Streptomyces aurantiogriseus OX=66870 GN=GCM10010251_77880 PE=3 SV=1 [Streptomyces aurantiogriseus]